MRSRGKGVLKINLEQNTSPIIFPEKTINKRMQEVLKTGYREIDEILAYLLQSSGKMLRPRLLYLSALINPHEEKKIIDIAVAVELIHMASLVHDDVIDKADSRRGKESVNYLWGNPASVLTGDYLFAAAFNLINRHSLEEVMDNITSTIQVMCTGEIKQLSLNGDLNITEEEYYEKTYRKTACLFASSCRVGALAAEAQPEQLCILEKYGLNLGYAYQLIDDVLDFTGDKLNLGKPVGNDLTQGNITLPVILALQEPGPGTRLRELLENGRCSIERLTEIVELLSDCGALQESIRRSQIFLHQALDIINELPVSPARQALKATGVFLMERYYRPSENIITFGREVVEWEPLIVPVMN